MRDVQVTYRVTGEVEASALTPHLVSRLASRLRERSSALGDAVAAKGVLVFSAPQEGHTASVVVGVDEHYRAPLVRVRVESSQPAKWAAMSLPVSSFLGLVVGAKSGLGVWPSLLIAIVVGVSLAYGVFHVLRRRHATQGSPTFAATRLGRQLGETVREVVTQLGYGVEIADDRIAGLDAPLGRAAGGETLEEALALGDEKAWTELMKSAAHAIPRSL